MKKIPIILEIIYKKESNDFILNVILDETGEIRQKKLTMQQVLNRLFYSELRTWSYNENGKHYLIDCDVRED